jgi:hypothetical protein
MMATATMPAQRLRRLGFGLLSMLFSVHDSTVLASDEGLHTFENQNSVRLDVDPCLSIRQELDKAETDNLRRKLIACETLHRHHHHHQPSDATCSGFFTVLTDVWMPGNMLCKDTINANAAKLEMQDAQMRMRNHTLTVFSTWSDAELADCGLGIFGFTSIIIVNFDPRELLLRYNFTHSHLERMGTWHTYQRLSDVFRLALAAAHGMAYLDIDMLLVNPDTSRFLQNPNIAVPVWNDHGGPAGTVEIQNSGFCLKRSALYSALRIVRELIDAKGPTQHYFYTELGPYVLQRALRDIGLVEIILTCNPWEKSVDKIVEQFNQYDGFDWIHIDKAIRHNRNVKDLSNELLQRIGRPILVFKQASSQ